MEVTLKQYADMMNVSKQTVLNWISSGKDMPYVTKVKKFESFYVLEVNKLSEKTAYSATLLQS